MTSLKELQEFVDELVQTYGEDKGIAIDDGGLTLVLVDDDSPWIERADQGAFEIGGLPVFDGDGWRVD